MQLSVLTLSTLTILFKSILAFPGHNTVKIRSVPSVLEESSDLPELKNRAPDSSHTQSINSQDRELQWMKSSSIKHDNNQNDGDDITIDTVNNIENQQKQYLCQTRAEVSLSHGSSHNNLCQNNFDGINSKDENLNFFTHLIWLTKNLRNWNSIKTAGMASVDSVKQSKYCSWFGCSSTPEHAQSFPKSGLKRRQSEDSNKNAGSKKTYVLPTPQNPSKVNGVAPGTFVLPTPKSSSKVNTKVSGSYPLPLPPPNLRRVTQKQKFHRLPTHEEAALRLSNGRKTRQQGTAQTFSTLDGRRRTS